jgi:hypothetical protein
MRKILHSQYTLHSHSEGTGLGSQKQGAHLLNSGQISELIMDWGRDESQWDMVAMQDEKCCEEVLLVPHAQLQSKYIVLSSAQAQLSIDA